MKCLKKVAQKLNFVFYSSLFLLLSRSVYGAGLEKANKALSGFLKELMVVIPIIATLVLIGLAIAYLNDAIHKDKFFKWMKGVLIIGCAGEIVSMFGLKVDTGWF